MLIYIYKHIPYNLSVHSIVSVVVYLCNFLCCPLVCCLQKVVLLLYIRNFSDEYIKRMKIGEIRLLCPRLCLLHGSSKVIVFPPETLTRSIPCQCPFIPPYLFLNFSF